MNAVIKNDGSKVVVEVSGRIDTTNVQSFEKMLKPLFDEKPANIELNCEALEYISSSGLRVFLILQKSVISYGGKLVITHMIPEIKEVFDMTGFSSIFTIA